MYLHAKNYQTIPSRLKVKPFFFCKLITDGQTCLSEDIYKAILHLTISLVRSYPYVVACHKVFNYSKPFESYSDFRKLTADERTVMVIIAYSS